MIPVTYNIDEHYRGDDWLGIIFSLYDESDSPVDMTGATAKMQLRKTKGSNVILEWNTSDNTITVSGNQISVNARTGSTMDIAEYKYLYDLEVVLSGKRITRVEGVFPIKDD